MGALVGLIFAIGISTCILGWRESGYRSNQSIDAAVDDVSHNKRAALVRSWFKRLAVALLVGIVGVGVTGLLSLGLLAAAVTVAIPGMLERRRATRQALVVEASWPDVLDSIISSVRAGMSLAESLCALAERGPEPLREPFSKFASEYRTSANFEASIIMLKAELADPVADRICEALLAARDVGGTDLGKTLRSLGDYIRQDLRFRGEARARQSWTVNGARLAVGAPWVVLVLLCTRPGTTEAYASLTGTLIIGVSALVTVVAYLLMMHLGQLPQQRRFVS